MTKSEIIAKLEQAIPANADYGEIDQLKVEHYNNLTLNRLIDAILEPEYDRFVQSLADNIKLGLKEW